MRSLSRGHTGEDVRVLQDRLNYHLRRTTPLVVDGDFGSRTQARVKQFQAGLQLTEDGIVGRLTRAELFEIHEYPGQAVVFPELTRPVFGERDRRPGIQPPRLIPPLMFPQMPQRVLPLPIQILPPITLRNVGFTAFQAIRQPSLLNMKFTVVPVKDMSDPVVRSTTNIIKLINDIPTNSKFKAFLVEQVPNPISKIEEPGNSFSFKPFAPSYSPLDPDKAANKGSAAFSLRLFGRPGDVTPQIALEGRAEGKVELEYTGRASSNFFKATSEWNFALGLGGVF